MLAVFSTPVPRIRARSICRLSMSYENSLLRVLRPPAKADLLPTHILSRDALPTTEHHVGSRVSLEDRRHG